MPKKLPKFTPGERRAKYKVARQLGATTTQAYWLRDCYSPKIFLHFALFCPHLKVRILWGLIEVTRD